MKLITLRTFICSTTEVDVMTNTLHHREGPSMTIETKTEYAGPEQRVREYLDAIEESRDFIDDVTIITRDHATGVDYRRTIASLSASDVQDLLNELEKYRNLAEEATAATYGNVSITSEADRTGAWVYVSIDNPDDETEPLAHLALSDVEAIDMAEELLHEGRVSGRLFESLETGA